MPTLQRHIFVCINERPPESPKGCCKHVGGEQVVTEFKKRLAELGLLGAVRANKAGCLGQCASGVTVVVYPEQVWYGGVKVEHVETIIQEHILAGRFVESLLLPDQNHLAAVESAPALRRPDGAGETG